MASVSPAISTIRLGHSANHSSPLATMSTAATATLDGVVNSTGSTFKPAICQSVRKIASDTMRMMKLCSAGAAAAARRGALGARAVVELALALR